jgi:hypothetical protein
MPAIELCIEDGVHQALVLDAAKGLRQNVSHLRLRVHPVERDLLRVNALKDAEETDVDINDPSPPARRGGVKGIDRCLAP